MEVQLRDPKVVMKLSKLGCFHQSKLSFLRSFLNEFKDWKYNRDLFDLDENGFGNVVYSFKKKIELIHYCALQIKFMMKKDQIE